MYAVSPVVAKDYLTQIIKAQLVPMLHGSPGIGKSDIVKSIADMFNLVLIDLRLSQCDPTDLNGFPMTGKDGKAFYAPMNVFPLHNDPLPKGKDGWLIFLDEFNSASLAVQKAAYKLTLDRMVGQEKLHKNVAIVCAGNLTTDGAIVDQMSTANQSRLVHIELTVSTDDWIEWAQNNGIDFRITSYISYRPSCLHMFDPDHSDKTFACPRTWSFVSKLIKNKTKLTQGDAPLLAGAVSEGVAREFLAFTKIFDQLPKIAQIISNPTSAPVPDEPSTLYAMSGVISDNITEKTITPLLQYVDRLPKEFQIITIREMSRRSPLVETNDLFVEKMLEVATVI